MPYLRNRILEDVPQPNDSSGTTSSSSIKDKFNEMAVIGIGLIGLALFKGCIPLVEAIFLVATEWVKHKGGVNAEKIYINDEIIQFEEYKDNISAIENVSIDNLHDLYAGYYAQCLSNNFTSIFQDE